MQIEKSTKLGFCYGVKRAMEILDKEIKKHGSVETLGEIVHNKQVIHQLAGRGVSIAGTVDDIKGNIIVLGTHGVTPEIEKQISAKHIEIVDTTCPFVRRARAGAVALKRARSIGIFEM